MNTQAQATKTIQGQPVLFAGVLCDVIHHRYQRSKQTALCLVVADHPDNEPHGHAPGMPFATATLAVPGAKLGSNEVVIKDYSENSGLLKALTDAGWVEPTGQFVQVGFVQAPIARLL